ncbi:MAG: tetratricopeptide repeat protein [Bacteroidia bacterium]|nr:tetratricopeptide repeat protein [Bacteroidia bacterium]
MRKPLVLFLAFIFAAWRLPAQLSPYQPHLQLYYDALELYEKQKYGAAADLAERFIQAEHQQRSSEHNDLYANARYLQAMSAYYLERQDAVQVMEHYLLEFSENSKAPLVQFHLGKYFFAKRKYRDAAPPLLEAYQSRGLPQDKADEAVYLVAYSYFMNDNLPLATRFFEVAASRTNPWQEDARYYRSVILYQQKDYPNAYTAFKELEKSPKYGKEIKVYLANTLLKLKRYDELYVLAEEFIATASRPQGKESQVFYVVANASFERNDYPRTIEYYQQFVKARGKMSRPDQFRQGYAHYKLRQYREAIPLLEQAAAGSDSLTQVSSYYLGFSYLEERNPNNARLAFQKASSAGGAKADPAITEDALFQYAKVCFDTDAYNEALQALTAFTERYPRSPNLPEAQAMIGEAYVYNRDYPRSIKYFESIARNTPRLRKAYQEVCYYYGLELFERPDYVQAAGFLQKAVDNAHDPNLALSAQHWIGESLFRRGAFREAANAYNAFLRMPGAQANEFFARTYYGLGWAQFKQKNYAAAQQHFDEFIARRRQNPQENNLLVDAYLRAGDCSFLQRNYTKANSYYRQALDVRYVQQDYALYQLGESAYRQGQYQNSVQHFDNLVRSYRDSELRDNALDRISEIYATWIKDDRRAIDYATMLVSEYPRSPLAADAYNRIGLSAFNSNDTDGAVRAFRKVLSDYSSDSKNTQIALDNLRSLLSEDEFDRVLKDYRGRNPQMNNDLARLVFSTGKDRFFSGNYPSAIEQFSTYIRDYKNGPDYFEALIYRGRAYRQTGQLDKAAADYRLVYETPTNNAFTGTALLEAAEIKYEQQDYQTSLQLYQQLEQVAGKLQNRVQAWFGIASNFKALKNYVRAQQTLALIADNPEVEVYSRTQAMVQIGYCQYLAGNLETALATFTAVENEYKNAFGAESQYMKAQILLDQGRAIKKRGDAAGANGKFEAVKEATLYQANNYPTFNYWKAKTFLVVADAYYEQGNAFQAQGTLESLTAESRFPDVQAEARKRLAEIQAETGGQ